jgi:hypothetical protein
MRVSFVSMAVVIGCLLTSCGTSAGRGTASGGGSAGAAPGGTCALLRTQEVQDAMGSRITGSNGAGGTGWQGCTWYSTDTVNNVQVEEVELQVRPADYFDSRRHDPGVNGDPPVTVAGIGDDAFSLRPGYVFVKKGSRSFYLRTSGELAPGDQRIAAARTLAAKVLPRV